MKIRRSGLIEALLAGSLVVGCESPIQITAGNSDIEVITPGIEAPTDTGTTVCDPLGGGAHVDDEHGLVSNLYYLPSTLPHYEHVADYQAHGTKVDATLYFSQLNVPTRPFDQGFMTQNGTVLTTPQGDTLYEWFSLHFESELKLSLADNPGKYQFAVLSDDGAVFQIDEGSGFNVLVDNDGTHSTKLACATRPVTFSASDSLKIKLDYYQGPRFHIALMLLWRQWPEGPGAPAVNDPACGQSGNGLFFNSTTTPPTAQPTWLSMLARGWKVIAPSNYRLPRAVGTNPCPDEPPSNPLPQVSDFSTFGFDAATSTDSLYAIWYTPGNASSSQIVYGFSPDSMTMSSPVVPMAVESHEVMISGLIPKTTYYIQAISRAADGRKSYSQVISKTTK